MENSKVYIKLWEKRPPLLVLLEFIAMAAFLSVKYYKQLGWDTYSLILAGILTAAIMSQLFFRVRVFRYLFSFVFSLFWGLLAFMLARELTTSKIACWITFGLIVYISLSLHKDYFYILRKDSDTTT